MTRRRSAIVALVAAVVAASAAIGFFAFGDNATTPVVSPAATTTSTTSTTVPETDEYTVATATVPTVQVIGFPPEGIEPTPGFQPREAPTAPIPRATLNSAGVRVTDYGFAYDNPTYFGNPLVFTVIAEHDDWVEVLVQARPNGQTGWVRKEEVELSRHDAVVEIDLTTRVLTATVDGEVVVEAETTIGLPANPTPTGIYFITEVIPQEFTGGPFGPYILATSAYSEQLDLFENGLPVVALHGTNEPDRMGEMATNGCVRLTNDLITLLAETLPPGVPLVIFESPAPDVPDDADPETRLRV